jgi:membrane protease YdiL (CAAX protease family)
MRATSYLAVLALIFACAYSQYLVKLSFVEDIILVYGIPCLVISLIWGKEILGKALNKTKSGLLFSLGYFGAFIVVGILLAAVVLAAIMVIDPNAAGLLEQPNPVLNVSPQFAELMIVLSFVLVGPAEEYIFRGFVFGGLLKVFSKRNWVVLAFVSSFLFAATHFYYVEVYGVASVIPFIVIISFGLAMAFAYYLSGGNLLGPALIHGAFDATGFIGVATTTTIAIELRGALILAGVVAGAIIMIQRLLKKEESAEPKPSGSVPPAPQAPPVPPEPPIPPPPSPPGTVQISLKILPKLLSKVHFRRQR